MLPFIELRTAVWHRERQQAGNNLALVAPGADPAVPGGRAGKCGAPVVPEAQVAPAVSKAVRAATPVAVALVGALPVASLASNTVRPCGRTIPSVMCCGQDFALAR